MFNQSLILEPQTMGSGNNEVRFVKRGSEYLVKEEALAIAEAAISGLEAVRGIVDAVSPRVRPSEIKLKQERGTETGYHLYEKTSDGLEVYESGIVAFDVTTRAVTSHTHTLRTDRDVQNISGNPNSHASYTTNLEVLADGTENIRNVSRLQNGGCAIVVTEDSNHVMGIRFESEYSFTETQKRVQELATKYGFAIPVFEEDHVVKKGKVVSGVARQTSHATYWLLSGADEKELAHIAQNIQHIALAGSC